MFRTRCRHRPLQQFSRLASTSALRRPPPLPRELPQFKSRAPLYLGVAVLALSCWAGFLEYALNYERASSSVVRTLLFKLKHSEQLAPILGDKIHAVPFMAVLGPEPYVRGSVNLLQGSVDVSFPIEGSKQKGTVYFTSIRQTKESKFEIIRFVVSTADGQRIELNDAQAQQ